MPRKFCRKNIFCELTLFLEAQAGQKGMMESQFRKKKTLPIKMKKKDNILTVISGDYIFFL